MAEFLFYPPWFWICLGGLMLAAELLGAAGYLLWSGIAAVVVALISWLFPLLDWAWLWLIFSLLTVIVSLMWWKWNKLYPKKAQSQVNQRYHNLLGVRTVVVDPIINGSGRIKIADSTWRATCDHDLPQGCAVEVVAIDGIILKVKAVDQP